MFKHMGILSALIIAITLLVQAHGDGEHVLGTIAAVDGDHVTIDTNEGKQVTVMVDSKTRYVRKKATASKADLQPGVRVAVDVEHDRGMNMLKATQVRFGSAKGPAKKEPKTDGSKSAPPKH